ncbi:MAG TPA: DNA-binding response regulator [Elusimicrobia bacterium]|nr:DNA-binding response regulator [Elusimicrobiota bacterium]
MVKRCFLIVEDDTAVSELVTELLKEMDVSLHSASTCKEARPLIAKLAFDLIILDRILPDGDGLGLCVEIRAKPALQAVPIMMLTSRGSVDDRVAGLESGADDYLPKPFDIRELRARIEALLKRGGPGRIDVLEAGGLRMEMNARRATLHGRPLELPPKEFELLAFLLRFKGTVVSRELLLERVWNFPPGAGGETKTVDVTVSNLRKRLDYLSRHLVTLRGQGYRLDL